MITVTLRQNNYPYPYYGSTSVVGTVSSKPVAKNLRTGYIDMQLDNLNFNYLSFPLKGKTIYAWITDIEHLSGDRLYRVHYQVDAFRTYRNNINIGTQFIERSPEPTNLPDPLLGSTRPTNVYFWKTYYFAKPNTRYLVVQVRDYPLASVSLIPGQPTMYNFYIAEYNINNWKDSAPVATLMQLLSNGERPQNIVTAYSVPHIDLSSSDGFIDWPLRVRYANDEYEDVQGWKVLKDTPGNQNLFVTSCPINLEAEKYIKTSHNISIVFPDAGIMNVPDSIAVLDDLNVKMYVDIFTGACNYILCTGNAPTHLSVRGGATASIPIISDPYDTYISQNQNTLMASMLGDVANLTYGIITRNPASLATGGMGVLNRIASLEDAKNEIPSTPPAFLGSALMPHFNKTFWIEYTYALADNADQVNARYGYPKNMVDEVTIPNKGFLKLQDCSVQASGYPVPLWAIEEINNRLNEGIYFV